MVIAVGKEQQTGARFRIVIRGDEIPLMTGPNDVGRSLIATVFVDDPSVSREHARITDHGTAVEIEDLGSRNGTFVNGKPISAPVALHDHDVIVLGAVPAVFLDLGTAETCSSDPQNTSGQG